MGRVTASAFFSHSGCLAGSTPSRFFFFRSSEKANCSYSSQVTSLLPIQNGAIWTGCCGLFVLGVLGLAGGAAHLERPAGNRHHLELDLGRRGWSRRRPSSRPADCAGGGS